MAIYCPNDIDYWSIADSPLHDPGGALTAGIWIKTTTAQSWRTPFMRALELRYELYVSNNSADAYARVSVNFVSYDTPAYSPPGGVNDGVWHLLVMTYDRTLGANRVKFYYDGNHQGSNNCQDNDVIAGADGLRSLRTDKCFQGTMAEIVLWDFDIGANAIATWYAGGQPVSRLPLMLSATKPIVYCPCDGMGVNWGQDETALVLNGGAAYVDADIVYPSGPIIVPAAAAAPAGFARPKVGGTLADGRGRLVA